MHEHNERRPQQKMRINILRLFLAMIIAILLSGCGVKRRISPPPEQTLPPAQVEEGLTSPRVKDSGPAGGLYRKAKGLMAQGKNQQAELALERALRIEPDNGYYWYTMGKIKYRQGKYQEAVQFCLKSISLAGKDRRLVRANDDLIEKSKQDSAN